VGHTDCGSAANLSLQKLWSLVGLERQKDKSCVYLGFKVPAQLCSQLTSTEISMVRVGLKFGDPEGLFVFFGNIESRHSSVSYFLVNMRL